MFTIDIVLGVLKKVFGGLFSFLWEYKEWIILAIVTVALYIRGNNYRDDYQQDYLAIQADKLNNSVKTLQEWGNMVIENSKQIASKGDKSE